MRVFISWSGEQSRQIGEQLRSWLPSVLQAVEPYFAPDDIKKGVQWFADIRAALEDCRVGLLCMTRDSLEARWLHFEAGALWKGLDQSRVVPLLFGVEVTDLLQPLAMFHGGVEFSKPEMRRVVQTINDELGQDRLEPDRLESAFNKWWPDLEEPVLSILAQGPANTEAVRSDSEILKEVLLAVRKQSELMARGIGEWRPAPRNWHEFSDRLREEYRRIEPAHFPKFDMSFAGSEDGYVAILHPIDPPTMPVDQARVRSHSYSTGGPIAWSVAGDPHYIRDLAKNILWAYAKHLQRLGYDVDANNYVPDYRPPMEYR